jgi:hypothetical protein
MVVYGPSSKDIFLLYSGLSSARQGRRSEEFPTIFVRPINDVCADTVHTFVGIDGVWMQTVVIRVTCVLSFVSVVVCLFVTTGTIQRFNPVLDRV